jgi:TPR repeat protein
MHPIFLCRAIVAGVITATALGACTLPEPPSSTRIESAAMAAGQRGDVAAETMLRAWAAQDATVAQRELGLLYRARGRADQQADAMGLLARGGDAGDAEAAYALGDMLRVRQSPLAAPWLERAATQRHAKAALLLALLYKNGELVAHDDVAAAHWLTLASAAGNPHAMFLLHYAYLDGRGVAPDPVRARALLEASAEHEYPPAQQELALAVQAGDALSPQDTLRASHLFKEANEHRHNNAQRF